MRVRMRVVGNIGKKLKNYEDEDGREKLHKNYPTLI